MSQRSRYQGELFHTTGVDIAELKHVVGRTSRADNLAGPQSSQANFIRGTYLSAGTPDANHQIGGSGLRQSPGLEIELERITIGFSKVGTGNVTARLRWRDKSTSKTGEVDYRRKIGFISEIFVILYETEDHRRFLLDGGTALLYLLRVSLARDERRGMFGDRKINDLIQLSLDSNPRDRATKTLCKDENACLKLYYRQDGWVSSTDVKKVGRGSNGPTTTVETIETRK